MKLKRKPRPLASLTGLAANNKYKTVHILTTAMGCLALATVSANAALTISSYTYGTNAASVPSTISSLTDPGNLKLKDGVLATGTWNDGTNVGFLDNPNTFGPQPSIVFDLGSAFNMTTVDIWTVSFDLGGESVSISSSTDNVTFGPTVVVNPMTWTGGFTNGNLRKGSIDVSSLSSGQYFKVEVFDPSEWMMINEVEFTGTAIPEPTTTALLGLGGLALILRRRK